MEEEDIKFNPQLRTELAAKKQVIENYLKNPESIDKDVLEARLKTSDISRKEREGISKYLEITKGYDMLDSSNDPFNKNSKITTDKHRLAEAAIITDQFLQGLDSLLGLDKDTKGIFWRGETKGIDINYAKRSLDLLNKVNKLGVLTQTEFFKLKAAIALPVAEPLSDNGKAFDARDIFFLVDRATKPIKTRVSQIVAEGANDLPQLVDTRYSKFLKGKEVYNVIALIDSIMHWAEKGYPTYIIKLDASGLKAFNDKGTTYRKTASVIAEEISRAFGYNKDSRDRFQPPASWENPPSTELFVNAAMSVLEADMPNETEVNNETYQKQLEKYNDFLKVFNSFKESFPYDRKPTLFEGRLKHFLKKYEISGIQLSALAFMLDMTAGQLSAGHECGNYMLSSIGKTLLDTDAAGGGLDTDKKSIVSEYHNPQSEHFLRLFAKSLNGYDSTYLNENVPKEFCDDFGTREVRVNVNKILENVKINVGTNLSGDEYSLFITTRGIPLTYPITELIPDTLYSSMDKSSILEYDDDKAIVTQNFYEFFALKDLSNLEFKINPETGKIEPEFISEYFKYHNDTLHRVSQDVKPEDLKRESDVVTKLFSRFGLSPQFMDFVFRMREIKLILNRRPMDETIQQEIKKAFDLLKIPFKVGDKEISPLSLIGVTSANNEWNRHIEYMNIGIDPSKPGIKASEVFNAFDGSESELFPKDGFPKIVPMQSEKLLDNIEGLFHVSCEGKGKRYYRTHYLEGVPLDLARVEMFAIAKNTRG